jgi:hypothetical protein
MPEQLPPTKDETDTRLGEAQAALWLSESLILALLEANLLDTDTILEAIDIVIAAKKAKAAAGGETAVARAAVAQLASISASIAAARVSADPAEEQRTRGERKKPSR